MSKIIFIDPGHGGTDPGAINGTRREANDNLRLALTVRELLVKQGQTVLLSRSDDQYISLAARTTAANSAGAGLFVSLHRNSFTNNIANGVETWVYTTAGSAETAIACEVQEQLAAAGVQNNRGVKKGNYHVCRETTMPAMLIELGFISNTKDNELFDTNFNAYAEAITRGILEGLGEDYTESSGKTETQQLYRVQVGAFAVKANAEAFLQNVKRMGLDAFLVMVDTAKSE